MNVIYPAKDRRVVTMSVAGALLVTTLMASSILNLFDPSARDVAATTTLAQQARETLHTLQAPAQITEAKAPNWLSRVLGRAL